jgi:FkbM family methyltransferase
VSPSLDLKQLAGGRLRARARLFAAAVRPSERPGLIRIGSEYGGFTVPDGAIDSSSVCYCGGVGDDVSFDLGLIERYGCAVHAFDPTPSSARHVESAAAHEERFHFYPWGLWSADGETRFYEPDFGDSNYSPLNIHRTSNYFVARTRSLSSIMDELGHERIDLLKLNIEGAEYEVLPEIVNGDVDATVICVGFHMTPWIGRMTRAVRALRRRGYVPVHLENFDVTFVSPRLAAG